MTFSQCLADYLQQLNCTSSELAQRSGLSRSLISRYLSGEREPASEGKSLQKLAQGIAAVAAERGMYSLTAEGVQSALDRALTGLEIDYAAFLSNLTVLLKALSVNSNDLAKWLSFDPSYISRILSGQRRPGDLPEFLTGVSRYIARRSADGDNCRRLAELVGCTPEQAADAVRSEQEVRRFLGSNSARQEHHIQVFLTRLDDFDLNEYIRSIRFDRMKVPAAPFQLPRSRICRGLEEMMEAELDFLKLTVLSKSAEDVFFYSEMPLEEMSRNETFPRRWLYGMALLLKKGLHLNMVHQVNRPLPEMLLGLEGWIPMYMTGQISPYYFKSKPSEVFLHHWKVSGAAALYGEAIAGHHAEGRYYLTNSREDVRYYQREAELMLQKAKPLMEIYTAQRRRDFDRRREELNGEGSRRMICSAFPLFLLEPETAEGILRRCGFGEKARREAGEYLLQERRRAEHLLEHSRISVELPRLSREEFARHPVALSLSALFMEQEAVCTFEEYTACMEQAQGFADRHPNCTIYPDPDSAFRNINISITEGEAAVVSKSKAPAIHFVIQHPKLLNALTCFVPVLNDVRSGE